MEKKNVVGFVAAFIVMVVFITVYGNTISSSSSAAISVPFTRITQGTQSNISERTNYLITSSDELTKLWKMVGAKGDPPKIDFTKDCIAAIFAGTVSRVEDTNVRTVMVTLGTPDGRCLSKNATTTPYEIVTVPITSLPLAHKDISLTNVCP
jgi:hypothetical protein